MAKIAKQTMAKKRKKVVKQVAHGKLYIQSTFNNTIVSVTDEFGNALSQASAGSCGFKGARKSTPYAAQIATKTAIQKAKNYGLQSVDVCVCGVGSGREQAVRSILDSAINITSLKDITPLPHNGCRAKKIRRV